MAAGMIPHQAPEPEDQKAKKAVKPKANEPPPPPKPVEAWTGPQDVYVVEVSEGGTIMIILHLIKQKYVSSVTSLMISVVYSQASGGVDRAA
jgi:hypothetical protein